MSSEAPAPGDAAEKRPINRLVLLLSALLLIGVLAVAVWLIWRGGSSPASATVVSAVPTAGQTPATDAPEPATDVPGDGFGLVSGPATPWSVAGGPGAATATASALAAVPTATSAPIALLGPPAGSAFMAGDVVTFYWQSPQVAAVGQQFVVIIAAGDEALALGRIAAANLGQGYQLQGAPGAVVGQPGTYSWLVVLADEDDGAIIAQSENRPLTILADN